MKIGISPLAPTEPGPSSTATIGGGEVLVEGWEVGGVGGWEVAGVCASVSVWSVSVVRALALE